MNERPGYRKRRMMINSINNNKVVRPRAVSGSSDQRRMNERSSRNAGARRNKEKQAARSVDLRLKAGSSKREG